MNYRKYSLCFIWSLFALICFNFIVWTLFTERIFTSRHGTGGDLARLGYLVDLKLDRLPSADLPRKHIPSIEYKGQQVDIVTIGDSFSAGGGGGRNNYYQDYIASINNLSVLNLQTLDKHENPLSTAIVLLNNGYLDILKPRILIIESIERKSIERFSKIIDFEETSSINSISSFYSKPLNSSKSNDSVNFLSNANLKYLYYKIAYLFSDSPTKVVVRKKLLQSMFTAKDGRTLLFYHNDLDRIRDTTPDSIRRLNDNFNQISEMLRKKGITLYFMPAVDKYNLYSEFIVNNPYPKSIFFEELRKLPKQYEFIDTKAILLPALHQGEKDVYYADDTHWSFRASDLIFSQVRFKQ